MRKDRDAPFIRSTGIPAIGKLLATLRFSASRHPASGKTSFIISASLARNPPAHGERLGFEVSLGIRDHRHAGKTYTCPFANYSIGSPAHAEDLNAIDSQDQ